MKQFTEKQHIKRHMQKENTHCFECKYCKEMHTPDLYELIQMQRGKE